MKSIFVGNLNFGATEAAVRSLFETYGTVERVNLVTDRDTGQARGFGFVEMTNAAEADRAIAELSGRELDGRSLNVNAVRPKTERGSGGVGPPIDRSPIEGRRRACIRYSEESMARRILLKVVPRDAECCLIDATKHDTVAFRGDAVDAPILCCGSCEAPLAIAVDRQHLTNMLIECGSCGSFNRTAA